MEKKKKYCSGCDSEQYIWKHDRLTGHRYCKNCWGKIQSKDPDNKVIPQVSAKRKKLDAEYLQLRAKHMEKFPLCQVKVGGCTNMGTDIHHTYAGSNRDVFYLIQSTWLVVCRNCHQWVHNFPKEARLLGYLK
jgi:hypothetical protein